MPQAALPALRGALLALSAALLFGASTPLVQRLGAGLSPMVTAALLYAGAALMGLPGLLFPRSASREAALMRGDAPRLLAIAACGAVLGPVALAWGLQRTSGTSASLMLTLEAPFTAVLAWALYRESLGRRVWMAVACLCAGGALLVASQGGSAGAGALGLLAVALATAAWGLDNALSRALADRDPGRVVAAKAAIGATASTLLAWALGHAAPSSTAALGLLAVGATGYGLSLRLYLLAQRAFGAARTASVFAFAPYAGVPVALALGEPWGGWPAWLAGALMAFGLWLHLSESHEHDHAHEAIEHEHAHRHDDGHHLHVHEPMPIGEHSHSHRHEPLQHRHPHVPDLHHAHRH